MEKTKNIIAVFTATTSLILGVIEYLLNIDNKVLPVDSVNLILSLFIIMTLALYIWHLQNITMTLRSEREKNVLLTIKNTQNIPALDFMTKRYADLMDITKHTIGKLNNNFQHNIVEVNQGLNEIINQCSTSFSESTLSTAIVSLRLITPALQDGKGSLVHNMYSSNVQHKRKQKKSRSVPIDVHDYSNAGYFGLAFENKKPILWDSNTSTFFKTRDLYNNFYNSGVTAPIFVNGKPWGTLSVDSIHKNAFSDMDTHILEGFGFNIGIILLVLENTNTQLAITQQP